LASEIEYNDCMEINEIVENQRAFFNSHKTQSLAFRKEALIRLEKSIKQNHKEILEAFEKDFNKCEFDVLSTELFCVQNEIKYFKRHLKSLMRPKKVGTGLVNFFSRGRIFSNPRGVVLVVSPWNYPLQLTLVPLVGAIAAGNTVVVKPSSYSPNVSGVIKKILSVFDTNFVAVVEGGREQNAEREYRRNYNGFAQRRNRILLAQARRSSPNGLHPANRKCVLQSTIQQHKFPGSHIAAPVL